MVAERIHARAARAHLILILLCISCVDLPRCLSLSDFHDESKAEAEWKQRNAEWKQRNEPPGAEEVRAASQA